MIFKATSDWNKTNTADGTIGGREDGPLPGSKSLKARERASKIGILEYGGEDGQAKFLEYIGHPSNAIDRCARLSFDNPPDDSPALALNF
jgi:hypothetical protein